MFYRILAGLVVVYFLSIGPVFSVYQGSSMYSRAAQAVVPIYGPLLRTFPRKTCAYLNLWGVSDIEAYFMINPVQLDAGVDHRAER
jgi:hypothetical protein